MQILDNSMFLSANAQQNSSSKVKTNNEENIFDLSLNESSKNESKDLTAAFEILQEIQIDLDEEKNTNDERIQLTSVAASKMQNEYEQTAYDSCEHNEEKAPRTGYYYEVQSANAKEGFIFSFETTRYYTLEDGTTEAYVLCEDGTWVACDELQSLSEAFDKHKES